MSKNKEIAEIFSKMADIMEFLGENPYRINAYRRVVLNSCHLPFKSVKS
jgi:DNA polymerase (family 10)